MTANRPDLDALEKLADEASEGPWTLKTGQTSYPECDDADSWSAVLTPRGREVVTLYERYGIKGEDRSDYDDDAAFIAAANPAAIKALIAEVRSLQARVARWEPPMMTSTASSSCSAFLARNGKGEG